MVLFWWLRLLCCLRSATGTVKGYPAKQIVLVKRQEVDDGPVVSIHVPAVDVKWLHGKSRKTLSEVERDYQHYRYIIDHDLGLPADVQADLVDDIDNVFAQEALWQEDGGSFFTADDRSAIVTALARLSKTVSGLGSDFATL